jgi:sugar O-acyltransferase (sialic acid O-acetyltransferase NeuD family)
MNGGPNVTKMVFWGATGQARALRECTKHNGLPLVALFDNNPEATSPFEDVRVHHGRAGLQAWLRTESDPRAVGFLIAIGGDRGRDRVELQDALTSVGLRPLVATHATAFIAASAALAPGAQVLAHATVCVDARLGRGVIVNTAASVDHECIVGDGSHLCPGARLAGCVILDRFVTIGTGAVVLPRIHVGEGSIVGAGAVVLHDVAAGDVVVGNPAKALRSTK